MAIETKVRLKQYKKSGEDPEECRRKRQEEGIQLRKVNIHHQIII